jgi:hypothetical protein
MMTSFIFIAKKGGSNSNDDATACNSDVISAPAESLSYSTRVMG